MTLHIRRHHQRRASILDRKKPNLPRFAKLQARCRKGAAVSASDDCSFAPYETHFAPETTARLHGLPAVPGSSFYLQCHPDFDIASALVSQPCETLSRGIPDTRGKDPAPARLPGQVRPLGNLVFFFRRASPGRLDDCPAGRSQTRQPTLTVSLLSQVALSCPSSLSSRPPPLIQSSWTVRQLHQTGSHSPPLSIKPESHVSRPPPTISPTSSVKRRRRSSLIRCVRFATRSLSGLQNSAFELPEEGLVGLQ